MSCLLEIQSWKLHEIEIDLAYICLHSNEIFLWFTLHRQSVTQFCRDAWSLDDLAWLSQAAHNSTSLYRPVFLLGIFILISIFKYRVSFLLITCISLLIWYLSRPQSIHYMSEVLIWQGGFFLFIACSHAIVNFNFRGVILHMSNSVLVLSFSFSYSRTLVLIVFHSGETRLIGMVIHLFSFSCPSVCLSFVERWTTDLPLFSAAVGLAWIILETVCWSTGWVVRSGEREGGR